MSKRAGGKKKVRHARARRDKSVVTLSKGDDFVQFRRVKGQPYSVMVNSAGDRARIAVNDARRRISTLTGAGWVLGGRGASPHARAMIDKSRAQLDREIDSMLRSSR